ncbi:MAG: hypothetical protein JXR83_13035 [Deltaproteobacteria bacterium]|nr:hypothetical protein [Deltaproteobacteria bacterium]
MVYSEKELELEGHTLGTQQLLEEARRVLDLAHRYPNELAQEGVGLKELSNFDRERDLVVKEHERVELLVGNRGALRPEMEKVVDRALRWRSLLVRRVDRAFADDRYSRLKYHRMVELHRLPERLVEELQLLYEFAKQDAPRLAPYRIDEPFMELGEDLLYELRGLPPPERAAWREYKEKMKHHRYGPPPKPPPDPPKLPAVMDNARGLSIMRGRVYMLLRQVSAAGQVAFTAWGEREPRQNEALRREFVLRIGPSEDDETLLSLGKGADPAGRAPAKVDLEPMPVAAETEPATSAPEREFVNPGGPPIPPPDPTKKLPARPIAVIRPSATRGRKGP